MKRRSIYLPVSWLEKAILFSFMLMCLISAVDTFMGRHVGNIDQLRAAKMQAQQELMAQRATFGPTHH